MRRIVLLLLVVLLAGCNLDVPEPAPNGGGSQDLQTDHLALGNPSNAQNDPSMPDNFLLSREYYALAYQRDAGIPRWVSWHLDEADLGGAERSQFIPDPNLPDSWYHVNTRDYSGSGYDRGHMLPSADRTASQEINQTVFYMTNIVPQAPDNNQGPWVDLENYSRDIVRGGHELYIITGPAGSLGSLAGGRIEIPASVWKVIVILPVGSNDMSRITADTEIIAVNMPNKNGIRNDSWENFTTSVDAIEALTGLDLLSNLPDAVENALEAGTDSLAAPPDVPGTVGKCDLIFSEYVEGSSNNKALELFNSTTSPINLENYRIELYSNGSASASSGLDLEGIMEPGTTLVIINSEADPGLLPKGNVISGVANFNGDDALVLLRDNQIIDVIGQVGFDPGDSWSSNGVATKDLTLRRKPNWGSGLTRAGSAFDVANQWDAVPIDDFGDLGRHSNVCR